MEIKTIRKQFETRGVLAGAYRGRGADLKVLLTHLAPVDGGEDSALCKSAKWLADSLGLSEEGRRACPTCPKCRVRWARWRGEVAGVQRAENIYTETTSEGLGEAMWKWSSVEAWRISSPHASEMGGLPADLAPQFIEARARGGAKEIRRLEKMHRSAFRAGRAG